MEITQAELLQALKSLQKHPKLDLLDCLDRSFPRSCATTLLKETGKTVSRWYRDTVKAWPLRANHDSWLFPITDPDVGGDGGTTYDHHREHGTMWVGFMGEQHEKLLSYLIQTLESQMEQANDQT